MYSLASALTPLAAIRGSSDLKLMEIARDWPIASTSSLARNVLITEAARAASVSDAGLVLSGLFQNCIQFQGIDTWYHARGRRLGLNSGIAERSSFATTRPANSRDCNTCIS